MRDEFELASTRRTLPMVLPRAGEAVTERFRPMPSLHDVSEQRWRVLRVLRETGTTDAVLSMSARVNRRAPGSHARPTTRTTPERSGRRTGPATAGDPR